MEMDQAPLPKTDMIQRLTSRRRVLLGTAAAVGAIAAASFANPIVALADDDQGEEGEGSTILSFSSMAGIHQPFLGDAGLAAFRGVHGGGAPWVISEGSGSLRSDGRLKVRVRGLVLDPAFVPAPNGGTNPIPFFMAIVSGFSTDLVNPVNIATPTFPASKAGDADIAAMLTLPHPLYAPIIFVASLPIGTPPAPRWFAVTGTA
jgi:hypothetical protein